MKGNFKERGEKYMKKDQEAQKRYGVRRTQQMIFPGRNSTPWGARVAIWLLQRYDARIVDSLKDTQKEE